MNPFFRFPVLAQASRIVPARSKAGARVQVVDVRPFYLGPSSAGLNLDWKPTAGISW